MFTAVGAIFLSIGASQQIALERTLPGYEVTAPTGAAPGYFGVLGNWDGNWYRSIVDHGYPRSLPVDAEGAVQQNEWAFYPTYPLVVRAVMAATGLPFTQGAWLVSLVFGAAAMVALFHLVRERMGRFGAGALVACVMAYVTAPVLQVAYTEGLALLLVVLFLAAVRRRRLSAAVMVAVVLSLTRPIALPLAVVLGTVLLQDWLAQRRAGEGGRPPVRAILATGAVVATVGLWPLVAWAFTGRPNAFFETQAAWPVNRNGLGGWIGDMVHLTPLGQVGILVVLYVAWVSLRPGTRLWGRELQVWSIAYPLYLILASRPSPSILRYLMLTIAPLWPFPGIGAAYARCHRWVAPLLLSGCLTIGLVSQYYWVTRVFAVTGDPGQQLFP